MPAKFGWCLDGHHSEPPRTIHQQPNPAAPNLPLPLPQKDPTVTTDDRCPLTDLTPAECGCTTHRRPGPRGIISAAALEHLIGRPAPEYRHRIRQLDTTTGALHPTAAPLDKIPTNGQLITCRACNNYPHSRDRWLCDWCTEQFEVDLLNVRAVAAELDLAVARQTRMGDSGTNGGDHDVQPLPFNHTASATRTSLDRTVRAAASTLLTKPPTHEDLADLAEQIQTDTHGRLDRHQAAPEHAAALRAVIRQALAIIDRPRPTTYLGPCPSCDLAIHAPAGAATHTCPCGQITVVAQAIASREHAIANTLVTWRELIDARIAPRSTLYWWRKHHHLRPVTEWMGHPMYRLGDAKTLRAQDQRDNADSLD